jgi:hypothetical protein
MEPEPQEREERESDAAGGLDVRGERAPGRDAFTLMHPHGLSPNGTFL